MDSHYQRFLAWLQLSEGIAAVIWLIGVAFGLIGVATIWGIEVVSGFAVGPQILFYIGFGVLVFTLVGAIAVGLYRWWVGRKKDAEDRIIAIAQGEIGNMLRALLEKLETNLPGIGKELEKALDEAFDNVSAIATDGFIAFQSVIYGHTHDEHGKAQFPRTKELREFLESVREANKESIAKHVDGHAPADTNSE